MTVLKSTSYHTEALFVLATPPLVTDQWEQQQKWFPKSQTLFCSQAAAKPRFWWEAGLADLWGPLQSKFLWSILRNSVHNYSIPGCWLVAKMPDTMLTLLNQTFINCIQPEQLTEDAEKVGWLGQEIEKNKSKKEKEENERIKKNLSHNVSELMLYTITSAWDTFMELLSFYSMILTRRWDVLVFYNSSLLFLLLISIVSAGNWVSRFPILLSTGAAFDFTFMD